MKNVLVACEISKPDIEEVLTGSSYQMPVIWIDSKNHDTPDVLHGILQNTIDDLKDYDEIILGFAYCGGALEGLSSKNSTLVFPVFDDCISILMHNSQKYRAYRTDSLFTGRGWMLTQKNHLSQYERNLEKYGEKKTERINKILYSQFKNLIYMQSEETIDETNIILLKETAEKLHLNAGVDKADADVYAALLAGENCPYICKVQKNTAITKALYKKNLHCENSK